VLVTDNPTLALDAVGPSTPTIQKRQFSDAGVGENAAKPGTAIGEGCQRRFLGASDGVKVPVDQRLDVGFGFGDGAKNLPSTGFRFDIADTYLEMPLADLATPDECRIQRHHDRWCHCFRCHGRTLLQCLTDVQSMAAYGLGVLRGVHREHLLEKIRSRSVGHKGGQMGLKLDQFRCYPAIRRPADTRLDPTTGGTTKSGKPHRDLAEKRRDPVLPVVFHAAPMATV
jgi:hypothetical protein